MSPGFYKIHSVDAGDPAATKNKICGDLCKELGYNQPPIADNSYSNIDVLNAAGNAGWELVMHETSTTTSADDSTWIFKRKIP